jgi:hypothetical protein
MPNQGICADVALAAPIAAAVVTVKKIFAPNGCQIDIDLQETSS